MYYSLKINSPAVATLLNLAYLLGSEAPFLAYGCQWMEGTDLGVGWNLKQGPG